MKKYLLKTLAMLLFTSAVVSGCSIENRESRRRHADERRHHEHDHDQDRDHNYHTY